MTKQDKPTIAILLSAEPINYLSRMRLSRIGNLLEEYAIVTFIVLNKTGVLYDKYPQHWRCVSLSKALSKLTYDYFIIESHLKNDPFVFNLMFSHPETFLYSSDTELNDFSRVITSEYTETNNDIYSLHDGIDFKISIEDPRFMPYMLLPYSLTPEDNMNKLFGLNTMKYKHPFQTMHTCIDHRLIIKAFKGDDFFINYFTSYTDNILVKSKYLISDSRITYGECLDVLRAGIIPILFDVKFPTIAIPGVNTIITSKTYTMDIPELNTRVGSIPISDRLDFIHSISSPANIQNLYDWIRCPR